MACPFPFFGPEMQQDPYPRYAQARADEPIFFSEELGMWVATRQTDVIAILRDPERFSSRLTTQPLKPPPPEVVAVMRKGFPRTGSIIHLDPPEHTAIRRKMNAAFTADRIQAKESFILTLANQLVDSFVSEGRTNLVKSFNSPLPVGVIADILGVARSDAREFGRWADDAARLLMSVSLPTDEWVQVAESVVTMQHYLADLVRMRKSDPADDLLTSLVETATDSNGELDLARAVSYATAFVFAGHKTTTDLIGSALRLLLLHPEQLAALIRDPSLAATIVEETLRRDCPVPGTVRVATNDVKLGEVTIPKDARIFALLGSANHDESVFESPMTFDIERSNGSEHVAFGRGAHFCLGAPLARLQGRVALNVLTQRLPGLRLVDDQPVKYWQVTMFRGPVALEVAWDTGKER